MHIVIDGRDRHCPQRIDSALQYADRHGYIITGTMLGATFCIHLGDDETLKYVAAD